MVLILQTVNMEDGKEHQMTNPPEFENSEALKEYLNSKYEGWSSVVIVAMPV